MKLLKATGAGTRPTVKSHRWRRWLPTSTARVIGIVVVAGATVLTSTTAANASALSNVSGNFGPSGPLGPVSGTKIQGGTAYFAEAPQAAPTYIFPFVNAENCTTVNFGQLFQLMYRPLYWYGNDNSPKIDYNYSIGNAPVFSNGNKTVTVTLKHYVWSDGETVSSRDIQFWMNMMFTDKENWCDYTHGYFPDNVASVSYPNSTTFVLHLKRGYNPTWFTYNELSQITPMPIAWDRTSLTAAAPSPTAANLPDMTPTGVNNVYNFLNCQAGDQVTCPKGTKAPSTTTYPTSPLWSIVDGPWKLSGFTSTGEVTFVPNPTYSGSPKPTISKFVELPFTDDAATLNEIKSGGPKALQVVELADENIPQLGSIESEGYNAANFTSSSIAYFPLNLHNPTWGPVFSQVYFRQAMAHLVDQEGWIKKIFSGLAAPDYGPVPSAPANPFADKMEQTNPYPFSPADAAQLLKAHGWTDVGPGETAVCSNANLCAPGDPKAKGMKLSFNFDYASGVTTIDEEVQDLASQAAQVGMKLQLTTHPFAQVAGAAYDCGTNGQYKPSQPECKWTVEDWGAGWVFAPDYEPTGESIFYTGAAANYEGYDNAKNDALIAATTTASNNQALYTWENYMIAQAPVVFIPVATGNPAAGSLVLVSNHLGGYTNNLFTNLTPETWYLTK